ncbi:hypothetical protein LY90DRAFT_514325 [Neocallimastix californiae]|uniref:Uncharacterized protein n=1 Tax=Neocallimastix californiae TaxID=1754190 RepID=A0A1Y2AR20_9FUNG|nr:hypothetical protein LY90DRAFT_514325 [Neocallimastix californiae]|eukprot:ORY25003.1 hypothetical protein LY90DRAFT_514325 [Neocallimastix californiae]
MKHKIKDGIELLSIPFGIKIKPLYNKISKEMGLICPEYNSIKSQISRNLNKKLPSNVTTFAEISSESEYYKTKRGENFMIFKNSNLIIFQSPFQAKLFREYNDDIFVDGTFFIAPKFSYQVFITRTYAKELDKHITNNDSESLNNYLNNLFPTKPSFYELIDKLNELEHLSYYDYQRKIRGIWKIKKRAINKANEISVLIERYKSIEAKLIDAKCDRNNIINLWFDCLTDLNNII